MPSIDTFNTLKSKSAYVGRQFFQRDHLCCFYIGHDLSLFQVMLQEYESDYHETNLQNAGTLLLNLFEENQKLPDVIIIDIPFDLHSQKKFKARLVLNLHLSDIPILYCDRNFTKNQLKNSELFQLLDDVVSVETLADSLVDKVMLLKQSKIYHHFSPVVESIWDFRSSMTSRISSLAKRSTDIFLSLLGLAALAPVILIIAAAIKLESRGPVLYTSERAGRGFRVFRFYKFRSMVLNADKEVENLSEFNQYDTNEDSPKFFKLKNDPRVTRLGKFLRNTSADELPQLINVLLGDMSIVGNRPLPIYEAVSLTTNEFAERFEAAAGITGLWQVVKRGKQEMSTEERIGLDITYSRRSNFYLDMKIIVKTPLALFQKTNA